jgi:uncharacterized membrane protein
MDREAGDYKEDWAGPAKSAAAAVTGAHHRRSFLHANFKGNLLAGLLTIAPLITVWLVFDFFLNVLSEAGHPLELGLTEFLDAHVPVLAPVLASRSVHWSIAVIVALLALYSIGAVASRVVGQRVINLFEKIITRIPLVESIYSASKKLVDVLRPAPDGVQRVVLIEFPHAGMKTLAFVMQVFPDSRTGEQLATVFVPTAPNPTSGYLEILPLTKLVPTDISADQAMAIILSSGAVAPDRLTLAPR